MLKHEGDALDAPQRKVVENALRDFRLAGVDLPPDRRPATAKWRSGWRSWRTKFSENVLDAGRAYTRSVTNSAELAGLPANAVDRAAADAREANQPAGCSSSISRPT